MHPFAIVLAVVLGLIVGVAAPVLADHVPRDIWDRLDRERF